MDKARNVIAAQPKKMQHMAYTVASATLLGAMLLIVTAVMLMVLCTKRVAEMLFDQAGKGMA